MKWYFKVLKQYADFSGRARRKEYWIFVLINGIIVNLLSITFPAISFLWVLVTFIPNIAVSIRRMHDLGKSGWYILIPIYNFILFCTDGETKENEYGEDPKFDVVIGTRES